MIYLIAGIAMVLLLFIALSIVMASYSGWRTVVGAWLVAVPVLGYALFVSWLIVRGLAIVMGTP